MTEKIPEKIPENLPAKSLDVRNIRFGYSANNPEVLKDVSFSTESGDLLAVLGPNGVGKSTLFKCILGFLKNYSGDIFMNGENIREMTHKEVAKQIAYIPQSTHPVFNYEVLDVVLMGLTNHLSLLATPKKEHTDEARRALESLGIAHLEHAGYGEISGGERQLVLIARALVQKSRILIMDEPTANLDYGNQIRVMKRVAGLAEDGYTIILSTHNPEHAFLYANRVVVMHGGNIIADGAPDSVLDEDLIHRVYGVRVTIEDFENVMRTHKICIPKDSE